jgi:hypothetical protein
MVWPYRSGGAFVRAMSREADEGMKLARRICQILGIHVSLDEGNESIVRRIQAAQFTPYFTSTQRRIRELIGQLLESLGAPTDKSVIDERLRELENLILWDKFSE